MIVQINTSHCDHSKHMYNSHQSHAFPFFHLRSPYPSTLNSPYRPLLISVHSRFYPISLYLYSIHYSIPSKIDLLFTYMNETCIIFNVVCFTQNNIFEFYPFCCNSQFQFLWVSNISLCKYIAFALSSYLLKVICLSSNFGY